MTNMPLFPPPFSVLMSVYRGEEPSYLADALTSVLKEQSLLPTEVVLVKDGSLTDELESVIAAFVETYPQLKLVELERNQGLARALNAGLNQCSYDWVARMDSDDVADSKRFERQFAYLAQYPRVVALGGAIAEFESSPSQVVSVKRMPTGYSAIIEWAKFRNPLNHMTVVFRKSKIENLGGYRPLSYMEDYDLWVRLLSEGEELANLPEVLVYARVGSGMYRRRGNLRQLGSRFQIVRSLRQAGLVTRWEACRNLSAMLLVVLLPTGLRRWIYRRFLRENN